MEARADDYREFDAEDDGGQTSTTTVRTRSATRDPALYSQLFIVGAHIATILICLMIFSMGITRCFSGVRPRIRTPRDSVAYWIITIYMLILPWLLFFLTLFYFEALQIYMVWYTWTYLGRGLLIGLLMLSVEWFDIFIGCIVIVAGIVFIVLGVLPFVPRPTDGLIPLQKLVSRKPATGQHPTEA